MADDTQAVDAGGNEAPAESPTEPKATETEEVTQQPESQDDTSAEEAGEPEETEAHTQSKRAESRQHHLAQKLKEKDEEVLSLRSQLDEFQAPQPTEQESNAGSALPWLDNQSREITPEEYKRDVVSAADQMAQLRVQQYAKINNRVMTFERDVNEVEKKYPELNVDADNFDPELSRKVTKLYKEASENNPDLRLKSVVDAVMDLRQKGEEDGKSKVTKAIAKQEAEAAATPGGDSGRRSSDSNVSEMLAKGEITAKEARRRGLIPTSE